MSIKPFLELIEWTWTWARPKPKRPRILVVEDNLGDAEMMQNCLHALGYEANMVHDAEGARALIARNHNDVVFVDMRLPRMEGWDLIPIIWRESPGSLVVVACGALEDLVRIKAAYGQPYGLLVVMPKPPSVGALEDLFERLRLGVGHRRAAQDGR